MDNWPRRVGGGGEVDGFMIGASVDFGEIKGTVLERIGVILSAT